MMDLHDLPRLNAVLNTLATVFLLLGYAAIRRGRTGRHRAAMLAALATSVLFLVSYLTYHFQVGSVRFRSQGLVRPFYFTILLSHTVLAVLVAPLVILTVLRALRGRFREHRRIARWTLPVWLYVSVTGVVVYLMLYHLDPRLAP
jgi:uncharacterized membrane protein YozB (DUF420 family)